MQETFQVGRPFSQSLVVARRDRVLDLPDELDPHLRHIVPCNEDIKTPWDPSLLVVTFQTVLGKPGPDL